MAFGLGEFTDFLNKGECFPEIAKSKGPLDAVGIVTQLPIGSLCLEELGFITCERRDAAATGCACFLGKSFAHVLAPKTISGTKGDCGRALIDRSPRRRYRASR
jgi:hypothetical protein